MAAHSSTLFWKIPWTEEPGELQSMGLLGVSYDWSNLAAAAAEHLKPFALQHDPERVTGRKARVLQMEEIACKCQTFLWQI